MESFNTLSFESLAEKVLGTAFPRHLAGGLSLQEMPAEARGVIRRVLNLMKQSGYSLTEFNPVLIRWLSSTVPSILPSAWGGQIPPITIPGRHRKFDDYVAAQSGFSDTQEKVFVDLGCGFPPVTTADTAKRFPDWQIYGVDLCFAEYVLFDPLGQYACFNRNGELLYIQPSTKGSGKSLYADLAVAKIKFCHLFEALCPLMPEKDTRSSQTVEKGANRLIRNHILDFQTDNLTFIESDITDLPPMNADVFRCMNLFFYFTRSERNRMMNCIKDHLKDNGLLIIGTNSFGIQARYFVYQKKSGDLVCREFAFSLDNLGHIAIMPWFAIHDDDPETALLAQLSNTLRSAPSFRTPFSKCQDKLLAHHGFCNRKSDGFLHFPDEVMPPDRFLKENARLWQTMQEKGYAKDAADVLSKSGYASWVNPAGDIAALPLHDRLTGPVRAPWIQ